MKFSLKKLIQELFRGSGDHPPDWTLIGIIILLTVFGLIILSSAGAIAGWNNFGDSYWYIKHQLLSGFFFGMIFFLILSRLDYYRLKSLAGPLLAVSIILLVLVFIPGVGAEYGSARSWLNVFGFSVQPSEIVKLTFLIYLASWLSEKGERVVRDFQHGFLPFLFVLGIIITLLVLQPDFGTMFIIIASALLTYFIGGGSLLHLCWLTVAGFGLLGILIKISPYRMARLTTFLHPELDPEGIGYHINQALLAIGSGGWFGRGFGHSRQKFAYLPEVVGDSIFAVVAEELGFFVSAAVVLLFLVLIVKGLQLSLSCRDMFGRLLAAGIISWFGVQAFLNIGAIIGLLPLTGVPLPFISYGGTALMTSLAAAGILVNISKQTKR